MSLMKRSLLLLFTLPAWLGCSQASSSEDVFLSASEQAVVETAAESGDLPAIKRLIAHIEAGGDVDDAAGAWRARARRMGDPQELYHHAARRLVEAQEAEDAERRASLLEEALEAARRSYAGSADPSTQLLVEQIARTAQAPSP